MVAYLKSVEDNRYIRSSTTSRLSGKGGYSWTQTQNIDSDIETDSNLDAWKCTQYQGLHELADP